MHFLTGKQHTYWRDTSNLPQQEFVCGWCDRHVASVSGYGCFSLVDQRTLAVIMICPNCYGPTIKRNDGLNVPAPMLGNDVNHLPAALATLYDEARRCTSHGAHTAAVMILRKMLMSIAVEEKAEEGKSFAEYVDYLSVHGLVPKKARPWVDLIRKMGNDATHKIEANTEEQSSRLLSFVEIILKTNYEFTHGLPTMEEEPK